MTSFPHAQTDHGDNFIRWSADRRPGKTPSRRPDPGLIVDSRRLNRYLSSLEGLSGE